MAYSQFDRVPNHYAGPIIQQVKDFRLENGKRSLCPTLLEIGQLQVLIPRHFGFCFGVERAIHMAFSTLEKHTSLVRLFTTRSSIANYRIVALSLSTTPKGSAKLPRRTWTMAIS
jgi:4-hydroxy-3-methylbut-2-enyl diphosphate reductase